MVSASAVYRALRVSVNGFTCWFLVLAGITVLPISPLFGIALLISAVDALFDVMTMIGIRIKEINTVLMAINYFTEGVAFFVGGMLMYYGVWYYSYFENWFFRGLAVVGAITAICAFTDLVMQRPEMRMPRAIMRMGAKYVTFKNN